MREYKTEADRVRYYSTERGEWEEIPLDLVDLKKTEAERQERAASLKADSEALAAEDKAERELRREVARVPDEPGVYYVRGEKLETIPLGETKLASSKKRSILKAMSPIPIVAGKSTLELDGETAAHKVAQSTPEFYMRLSAEQRFAIVKLTPKKAARVVQTWNIVPVSNEIIEEHTAIEIFRHQVGEGLYKIWPQKPLERGEYAVIEYTEGKGNTRVWDFSWTGASPAN